MKRLFIFDMDGTLLMKTTANIELSKITKTQELLDELEFKYKNGKICTTDFSRIIYETWGILEKDIIQTAFNMTPKLKNIEKVVSHIADNNSISCIMTMSSDYYADLFYDYGFNHIFASRFPKNLDEPFIAENILVPKDKVTFAKELCKQYNLNYLDSIAFGDSMSDKYLFNELEHTICINGDEQLRSIAKHIYDGDDLWDAYKLYI